MEAIFEADIETIDVCPNEVTEPLHLWAVSLGGYFNT